MDGQTDNRRRNMTQLIGVYRDYAEVPDKKTKYNQIAINIFQFYFHGTVHR